MHSSKIYNYKYRTKLVCLYTHCHHQIVFAKFNLSIFYPPPYERTVWYYERANTELMRRAIDQFDWLRALSNVNVAEKEAAQHNPNFYST